MKRLLDIHRIYKLIEVFTFVMLFFVSFPKITLALDESKLPTCSKSINNNERIMPYDRSDDSEKIAEAKKSLDEAMDELYTICDEIEKKFNANFSRKYLGFESPSSYRNRTEKIISQDSELAKKYKEAQQKYAQTYSAYRTETALYVDQLNKKDKEEGKLLANGPISTTPGAAYTSYASKETAETYKNTKIQDTYTEEDQQKLAQAGLYDSENTFKGGCNIQSMRERYQSKCYSCVVIKTLMETFLNACSKAYDVTSEAGVKLLVLGALIWMAFFVMKNVSSLSSIEPGAMMNTLAVFLFKVMVAYILITSGLGVLIKYTINPLLTAGADMGIAFTDTVSNISKAEEMLKDREKAPEVKVPTVTVGNASTEIVPAEVLNKVMLFAERLDKNVSTNLVIGHAVTCWSMKGGAWTFNIFGVSSQWTTIKVINLWLWFCGALIWFVGFMLTLGIGYYLLDISFKLGFSIMALPVAIGLWPFNITKGTVTKVISIMLKAAGTFVFLGLTTSYALAMISFALRDVNVLFDNVEKGNAQWISETFELTGPYFLIILFAFLYSMKLISSTISDYVNQFFADSVFGDADPMHKKLTQATDFAKQQLMKPVKKAVGKISNEVGEQAKEGAVRAGKFVRGLFKGKANGDVKSTNRVRSGGGGNNPMSNAGKATKAAGATAEQTGKGVQAAGKGAEVGGKVAQAGGKGIMSGGKGMVSSGATMCGTGVGAIVGVPMMIAGAAVMAGGAATYAAGKCAEVAGKAAQKAGKVIQKGGKAMKKAGEKMEKAGAKMEKLGNKLKFGDEKAPKPESEGKPDENNEKPTAQEEKPNKENQTDDKKAAGGKNEK